MMVVTWREMSRQMMWMTHKASGWPPPGWNLGILCMHAAVISHWKLFLPVGPMQHPLLTTPPPLSMHGTCSTERLKNRHPDSLRQTSHLVSRATCLAQQPP